MRRRISRAEYDTIKATCAARIRLRMEQLNLTPSEIQRLSGEAVMKREQVAYVSMPELAAWKGARQLPKDLKLAALAAVLQDKPDSFVPREHQTGRSLVARKLNLSQDELNGNYHVKVTSSHASPGNAYLEVRILLPTAKAYDVAKQFSRLNSIENMRRMGMDDETIKGHLAHAEEQQRIAALEKQAEANRT